MEQKTYTIKEAAELLSKNEETIRRWVRDGKLHASKLGKSLVITRWDLQTFTMTSSAMQVELNPISGAAMGNSKAFKYTHFLDNIFLNIAIQRQRIEDDKKNVELGLKKQDEVRLASGLVGAGPGHYWQIPQNMQFMDIHHYFIECEALNKLMMRLNTDLGDEDFTKIYLKHKSMLGMFKVIRGMQEHLIDKQLGNSKLGGDYGNIDNDGYHFGGKHYGFRDNELMNLKDEIIDYFKHSI